MAQTEDTELRDLVIEALEKNGSLAKIRALLRANVFLVFEDECENIKQNVSLDNVLQLPEGALCLSIIHEFLEFCNLKNTLFVYMAESRQRKDYIYEGQPKLAEKLNLPKRENVKEPILVQVVKHILNQRKYFDQTGIRNQNRGKCDDQNCTYIVHEDTSSCASSNSHSDNSSDEKNKLHLRLALDNSDTDTSSDSAREKSCSEYIPNKHVIESSVRNSVKKSFLSDSNMKETVVNQPNTYNKNRTGTNILNELKLNNNSSSESTSYVELKPPKPQGDNCSPPGIPIVESNEKDVTDSASIQMPTSKSPIAAEKTPQIHGHSVDTISSEILSSTSLRKEEIDGQVKFRKSLVEDSGKSETETADYSYDFTSSPVKKDNDISNKPQLSPESIHEEIITKSPRITTENQHHSSQSSRSSVSISDVADLISEKSYLSYHTNNENKSSNNSKRMSNSKSKISDDSADFSESPIPSLSNLSFDIQSD